DYGRKGADGKERDLHIEQALEVTNRVPIINRNENYPHIADCDYFTVDKLNMDGIHTSRTQGTVTKESFLSILILDGEGIIRCQGEALPYKKGDSFFLPAASGDWQMEGVCDALLTTIREKEDPMRIGINIGSHDIQIGIVDENQELVDVMKYKMDTSKEPLEIIEEVANQTLSILDKNNIPLDQCTGIGVGVPGTIDRKQGNVLYSNNIQWEDVPLAKELEKVILCPVRIANDADCAALGEAVAGAGKDFNDVVMFTLGNGVGGGLILNGEVFEGGIMGGSEVGHMSIQSHGRPCTCGRKGCLEAYVSIPALLNDVLEKTGKEMSVKEIFENKDKDEQLQQVMDAYIQNLATGLVNIVNIFRPQLILLGGSISEYAPLLIPQLKQWMKRDVFGGKHGMIPEIAVAQLGNHAGLIGAANL
ncbi:MAG: ROK family protein, partial [Erysipelotrichaceae bacterium]|nr:ROK family protein [Erysipelotrichaceae bacterium]